MTSFSGHAWRVREAASGKLLAELVLDAAPTQHRTVEACGTGGEAPPEEGLAQDAEWLEAHGRRHGPALAECPLVTLLSEDRVRGFHVACAVADGSGAVGRLCIFADGQEAPGCTHTLRLGGGESVEQVTAAVVARVLPGWQPKPRAPGPALFTASGRRLPGALGLKDVGVPAYRRGLVLLVGGQWHWPPIRVGFERPLHGFVHSGSSGITLRTLSLKPRIFEVKSFIKEAECDRMLEKSAPHVHKSSVVVKDADHGKAVDDWRTSFNYFLQSSGDTVLEALDERVQNVTRIPIMHSEHIQVLKYEYQGRYVAHHDYFEPADYSRDAKTLEMTADGVHNRLLTVFMYMSDVQQGGETYFPAHGGRQGYVDYADCSRGFSVPPERRKVIIFYNMHPDGSLDPDSLHGGCRVLNGTKWSANFWVWNVPRDYKRNPVHKRMALKLRPWEEHIDREEEAIVSELAGLSAHKSQLGEEKTWHREF